VEFVKTEDFKKKIADLEKFDKNSSSDMKGIQEQIKKANKKEIESMKKSTDDLIAKISNLEKKQNSFTTKDSVNLIIKEALTDVPKSEEKLRSELDFIQETIEQMQEGMESFSGNLRNLPTKKSIIDEVEKKLIKLKEEQAKKDEAQDNQLDKQEMDQLFFRIARFEEVSQNFREVEAKIEANTQADAKSIKNMEEKLKMFSKHSQDIKTLETKLNKVEGQVANVETTVNRIESEDADQRLQEVEYKLSEVEDTMNKKDQTSFVNSLKEKNSSH